jgi:drug/metabolite transporter (DMT)-like permease
MASERPAQAVDEAAAQSVLRGVVLVAAAVLVFAFMDVATKHLATRYNVPLVMALRYLVMLGLLAVVVAMSGGRPLLRTQRTGLVLVRAACLALVSLCAGMALQRLPVPETVAMVYLAPFGVLLLAGPLLGERVGLFGWAAATAGFVGLLLIARPGGGLALAGVVFALLAAAATVGYQLLSRVLAPSNSTLAMLFYAALIGAVFFGAMLPWSWYGPAPTVFDVALFGAMGAMAGLAHFLFTAAYQDAPASLLAPVNYVHLVWAGGLGWIVFGHIPDGLSLLGMATVMAAGVAVGVRAHRLGRGARSRTKSI